MSSKKKSTSSRSAKSKAKVYVSDDEDEAFVHTFDVLEKLKSKSFPKFFIKEMKGEEVMAKGNLKLENILIQNPRPGHPRALPKAGLLHPSLHRGEIWLAHDSKSLAHCCTIFLGHLGIEIDDRH